MRVVFMGTPDFSTALLQEICARGHEVVAAYSQPPRPAGRGMEPRKSPVHALADRLNIPVFTPKNFRDPADVAAFAAHDADVAVVAAYGLILPKAVLAAPRYGCLNLHGSALPRWRGAAPIQRAIMAGDEIAGADVMQMEEGLDTGPVGASLRLAVPPDMTAGELHDVLSARGALLMADALDALGKGALTFTPQSEAGVLYAAKIDKSEARIDWRLPARDLNNRIRGLSPFPGAYFETDFGQGAERVKLLAARVASGAGAPGEALNDSGLIACGEGALQLQRLQRAGKAPLSIEEFLRGRKIPRGAVLG
jgi:methionyl-tRNA formyltransferase